MTDMTRRNKYERAFAPLADRIAKSTPTDPELMRDYVDMKTGGELDYFQLNMLTDMVEARIKPLESH